MCISVRNGQLIQKNCVISQVTIQEVDIVYEQIRSTQGWLVLIQLTFNSVLLLQDSELSKVRTIFVNQRLLYWWSGNLSTSNFLPILKTEAGA
jgi:hypothetical protein